MKEKVKLILSFLVCWLISFLVIFLFVFFGGFKLFESKDVYQIEIGVSFVFAIFLNLLLYVDKKNSDDIEKLKNRIEELEEKYDKL